MSNPYYARSLAKQIRKWKAEGCRTRFGAQHLLKRKADPEIFEDVVAHLGESFSCQELYDFLFPKARRTCSLEGCNEPVKFLDSGNAAYPSHKGFCYVKYCSSRCNCKSFEFLEKRTQTWLDKTDGKYSHPSKTPESRKKHSMLLSSEEHVVKMRKRELKRSGGKYIHPTQRPEVHKKIQRSSHRLYTVRHKGYKWDIQGYEDVAIRWLVRNGISPEHITVPKNSFTYIDGSVERRYFPDLRVEAKHPFYVEVKSLYTASYGEKCGGISVNLIDKILSVASEGEHILTLVIDKVDGQKGGKPRNGEIDSYIYSRPNSKKVRLETDPKKLLAKIKTLYRSN